MALIPDFDLPDYAVFMHGLAFIGMASVLFTVSRQRSLSLPWAWLVAFGVLHGSQEWTEIPALLGIAGAGTLTSDVLALISFSCAIEFARRTMGRGWWLHPIYLAGCLIGTWFGPPGLLTTLANGLGCVLGPGLIAILLWQRAPADGRRLPLRIAAAALAGYAICDGGESHLGLIGLDKQWLELCQTACALVSAWGFWLFAHRPDGQSIARSRSSRLAELGFIVSMSVILLGGWQLTVGLGDHSAARLHESQEDHLRTMSSILGREMHAAGDQADLLATSAGVRAHLASPTGNLSALDEALDRFAAPMPSGSICYAMDPSGLVIATSNRRQQDSLRGKSFAFRPYFRDALTGGRGSYLALGVTTRRLGYYTSRLCRDAADQPRMVIVVKRQLPELDEELPVRDALYLCDPQGIVAYSNRPQHRFGTLRQLSVEAKAAAVASRQFGNGPFDPISFEHGCSQRTLPAPAELPGWQLVVSSSTELVAAAHLLAIGLTGMLFLVVLTASAWSESIRIEALRSRNAESRFKALFAGNGVPQLLFDPRDGIILDANQAATAVYGTDLRGRSFFDLSVQDQQAMRQGLDGIGDGRTTRFPFSQDLADGSERHVEVLATAMRLDGRDIVCASLIDVTEQRRAATSLVSARAAAESASIAKSQFLATMSHEIRTPLNGVLGMATLLRDMQLTVEQREMVQTILHSGDHLLTLINDILDLSKIEAERMVLEAVVFNPRTLVEDVLAMLAPRVAGRRIDMTAFFDATVPPQVRGDPNRLRQIITNLLANALKFTEEGEVLLRCSGTMTGDGALLLQVTISDTGVGIPPDRIGDLFSPFIQVDSSVTRRAGGTGLGLAISKRLVGLMGGEITVESRLGLGSIFRFTARVRTVHSAEFPAVDGSGQLRGIQVLVAVEHAATRESLFATLRGWGCTPLVVRNADDIRPGSTGFLLIDLDRPDLAGCVARLRETGPDLRPIGLVRIDHSQPTPESITDVLAKPVRAQALRERMLDALRGAGPTASDAAVASTDLTGRVLMVEDDPINQLVIREMLIRLGLQADLACNGEEAVSILSARTYDLVLMDCQMPVMDGLTATRIIRDRASAVIDHTVPILAVTADAIESDLNACLAAGMDDHLTKPLLLADLKRKVGRLLKKG